MRGARRSKGSIFWMLLGLGWSPLARAEAPAADPDSSATTQARAALRSPRLYVLDCGTIRSDSPEEYGLARNEVAGTNMADPCFLVVHRRGVLLFDTGLPDRLAGHPTVLEGYGLEVTTRYGSSSPRSVSARAT
jgi:hypothetical protein